MTSLSFYDFNRQDYAKDSPVTRDGEDEFMIGGYCEGGGVDERGEYAIVLHRFSHPNIFGRSDRDPTMAAQLRAFDDGFGALRECIALGLLDALESVAIHTPDDLAGLLTDLGLRDCSHNPVAA